MRYETPWLNPELRGRNSMQCGRTDGVDTSSRVSAQMSRADCLQIGGLRRGGCCDAVVEAGGQFVPDCQCCCGGCYAVCMPRLVDFEDEDEEDEV